MPLVQKIDDLVQRAANTLSITPTAGNSLIATGLGAGATSALVISDNAGNTWHPLTNNFDSPTGLYFAAWIAFNVAGSATTVLSTPGAGPANGFTVCEYSGLSASSPLTNFSYVHLASTAGLGANGAVGAALTTISASSLLFSWGFDFTGNAALTAGTSPIAFTNEGTSIFAAYTPSTATIEDATVSSGTPSATFGTVSGNHFDDIFIFTVAISLVTDTIPCGTTASGATVATGTGGLALPAFAVGDCIVVLTMAQTASALTETFNGDGSNAYTHLQVADNHSTEGFILSRYATIVTTPLASPVLQSTFSGSAKLGIAAVKVGSISPGSPFVPGGNAQHLQTTPSGTNSQVSGLTTSANTNIPVTLVAWGLSVNFAGAPTAGSGFTPQGTAWSAFGAPCLTCETQTSSSLIQQQATFTPIGGSDTYTFLDVFNQLSVAFQIIMGQACL